MGIQVLGEFINLRCAAAPILPTSHEAGVGVVFCPKTWFGKY
jgi:hypothetical protein